MSGITAPAQNMNDSAGEGVGVPERPLLLEFAELWSRGLADERKLWQLFDVCEMYLYRPDYFGAPIFKTAGRLVTPVFSSEELLTRFMMVSPLGPDSGEDGFDWVRLSGAKLFGLPVRARHLVIDPEQEHFTMIDLASREDPPPLADGAPPFAINLQATPDGKVTGGPGPVVMAADEARGRP